MGLNRIIFDSPSNCYYPGCNITGKVELSFDKPSLIRALTVTFTGSAKVKWTQNETVKSTEPSEQTLCLTRTELSERTACSTRTKSVNYSGKEEYFFYKYNLLGGNSGEVIVPAGYHSYSFNAFLPSGVPSSYEGKCGHIRYSVTATLSQSWRLDETTTAVFEVVSLVDLNCIQQAKESIQRDIEKNFCCLWCKSGPLQLTVSMPCAGFIPGQSIPITVDVDNASKLHVNNISIILKEVVTWRVREPREQKRIKTKELAKMALEGIDPNSSRILNKSLLIPIIKIVNLDQCSLINLNYMLMVKAHVEGCHRDLYDEFPVFFGNVPIQQSAMNQQPSFNPMFNPTAPEMSLTEIDPVFCSKITTQLIPRV